MRLPRLPGNVCNHPDALFYLNTGSQLGSGPGIRAWVAYGLETLNQNLPGYAVMTKLAYPQGGARNWSNGFLPAYYQGTTLRPVGSTILDLQPPEWKSREQQRASLDMLGDINRDHATIHPYHNDLAARMESYELAYRLRAEVPGVIDIAGESEQVQESYRLNDPASEEFGRRCLLAHRLIENGVRFVQIFSGGWDSHDYLERNHSARIRSVDKAIATLVKDLKARSMLDETLLRIYG